MLHQVRIRHALALCIAAVVVVVGTNALTQTVAPINLLPNPYQPIENWAKLPEGRAWGSVSAVDIDLDGSSVWVAERCGAFALPSAMRAVLAEGRPFACHGLNLDPILKFDASRPVGEKFWGRPTYFPTRLACRPRGQRLGH